MIYNEFGDDPLDTPDPIPVEMCPTFYGFIVVCIVAVGIVLVCVAAPIGLWLLMAALVR